MSYVNEPRPPLSARRYASMAATHLDLAEQRHQPSRLEHQEAALRQLRRAERALLTEMEADR